MKRSIALTAMMGAVLSGLDTPSAVPTRKAPQAGYFLEQVQRNTTRSRQTFRAVAKKRSRKKR